MKKSNNIFNFIFLLSFLFIAFLLILFPDLNERFTIKVLVLIGIGFFPWFIKYIKSLEINGIVKVDFFSKEKVYELEEKTENIQKEIEELPNNKQKSKMEIAIEENRIALEESNKITQKFLETISGNDFVRKLAYEFLAKYTSVEKMLRYLAESNNINEKYSLRNIVNALIKENVIDKNIYNLLEDVKPIRNEIVHNGVDRIMKREIEISLEVINTIYEYLITK